MFQEGKLLVLQEFGHKIKHCKKMQFTLRLWPTLFLDQKINIYWIKCFIYIYIYKLLRFIHSGT